MVTWQKSNAGVSVRNLAIRGGVTRHTARQHGLGAGDTVDLRFTSVSCTDVAALQAKGVTVDSGC